MIGESPTEHCLPIASPGVGTRCSHPALPEQGHDVCQVTPTLLSYVMMLNLFACNICCLSSLAWPRRWGYHGLGLGPLSFLTLFICSSLSIFTYLDYQYQSVPNSISLHYFLSRISCAVDPELTNGLAPDISPCHSTLVGASIEDAGR